jgi:hypothetical protein
MIFKKILKWSLKNHPDKSEATRLYQIISGCRTEFLKNFTQNSATSTNT